MTKSVLNHHMKLTLRLRRGASKSIIIIAGSGMAANDPKIAYTVSKDLLTHNSGSFRDLFASKPLSEAFQLPRVMALPFEFYVRFLTDANRDLLTMAKSHADRACQTEALRAQRPSSDHGDLEHEVCMLEALCNIWYSAHGFRDPRFCNAAIDAILHLPNLGPCAIICTTKWCARAMGGDSIVAQHLDEDTPLLKLMLDSVAATMTPNLMRSNFLDGTWSLDFGAKLTLRLNTFVHFGVEVRVPTLGERQRYYAQA